MMHTEGRDRLTGLHDSASALFQLAEWQASAAPDTAAPIHAILLSLKRFSAVNLAYGEAAGDSALVEIASRISTFARDELDQDWLVSRIRGGTFLLAAREACSRERWQWFAEELALTIASPIVPPSGNGSVRLWPRMALLRAVENEKPARMLGRMGEALESGRHNPGQRFCWVDGTMSLPGRPAQQLEADLIAALDRDEIEVLYQPQFSCVDNRLVGAEALARWQHPELGRIGAGPLFAIAERADHLGQLSRQIARQALDGAKKWPADMWLSLNVTPADIAARDFGATLIDAVEDAGFSPQRLKLEITEQTLVADLARSARRLQPLAELGIGIALDDFGAGFCNFRYLKMLPLNALKLDRSMIEGIVESHRDLAVLQGILAMAKALELDVIAEGIENEAQREIVAREGCAAWQGFLGAKPMTGMDLSSLLGERSVFFTN